MAAVARTSRQRQRHGGHCLSGGYCHDDDDHDGDNDDDCEDAQFDGVDAVVVPMAA